MPDIKIKPTMDKPKLLEKNYVPKNAESLLKQQYEERKKQREPERAGGVRYATDRTEGAAKHGTVIAEMGTRRAIKQFQRSRGQRAEQAGEPPTSESEEAVRVGLHMPKTTPQSSRASSQQAQTRAVHQYQMDKRKKTEKRNTPISTSSILPDTEGTSVTTRTIADYEGVQSVSPKEQGRQKAVADARKARRGARYPAEKEMTFGSANRGAARANNSRPSVRRPAVIQNRSYPRQRTESRPAERSVMQRMRQTVQRKAHQKTLRQTAENTAVAVRGISGWTAEAAAGISKAAATVVHFMSTTVGGTVLLIAILFLAAIGGIAASPFGILFAGESTGSAVVPVSCAVAQVNDAFNERLEELQTADTYDDVTIQGEMADWVEVLAVFASKVAGSSGADAADVVTLDADRITRLQSVFLDMSEISSEVERIEHPDSDPDDGTDDSWTEKILHITITPKSAVDMPVLYGFTTQQTSVMNELLAQREMLQELIGDLFHVSADAADVLMNLPDDVSPERRAAVEAACSLAGKVNYFWGGKSLVIGWDSQWGMLKKVTADGSPTTGTFRPYGLDCSGFVDWVFYNATEGDYIIGHGGGAHAQHTYCTPISWEDAIPGDLVFYPDDTHVGIVGGWDKEGNLIIIHCSSGHNNVVITTREGFVSIGRPRCFAE